MTKPEELARVNIDKLLKEAGWSVQEKDKANLGASLGVAVTFFQMKEQKEADYVLFIDRKAVGIIEAKAIKDLQRVCVG